MLDTILKYDPIVRDMIGLKNINCQFHMNSLPLINEIRQKRSFKVLYL